MFSWVTFLSIRSLLMAELEKEEKEKDWYYAQLQNLTKRIDSLPLTENVSKMYKNCSVHIITDLIWSSHFCCCSFLSRPIWLAGNWNTRPGRSEPPWRSNWARVRTWRSGHRWAEMPKLKDLQIVHETKNSLLNSECETTSLVIRFLSFVFRAASLGYNR